MNPIIRMPQPAEAKVKRLDNHRIFRPEAVEAYTTRRAGEAWEARLRLEGLIITALAFIAIAALVFVSLGGR